MSSSNKPGPPVNSATIALVLLPFVAGALGSGRYLGWIAGGAVVMARWKSEHRVTWTAVAVANLTAAAIGPVWFRGTSYHWGAVMLALVGLFLIAAYQRVAERTAILVAAVASLGCLAWAIAHDPGGYLDVGLMHRAGADALRSGSSPWQGLAVPSGAPGAEGSVVTGDPYPPAAMIWYSFADWLTGDPRAAGVAAWTLTVVSLTRSRVQDRRPLIVVLTSTGLPLLLWTGWTEFITIALLGTGVWLWTRPAFAAVVLGLAMATKQYMVVAAPLVFGLRTDRATTRKVLTLGTAAGAAALGFAMGPGYLHAIIGVYAEFEARSDSASLFGVLSALGVNASPPAWLGPVAAMIWASQSAYREKISDLGDLFGRLACGLTILFLLGTQAFSNYWYLVWVMLLLALARPDRIDQNSRALEIPEFPPAADR